MCKSIEQRFQDCGAIEIINGALWDASVNVPFVEDNDNMAGSYVSNNGNDYVKGVAIDDLGAEKITFIKMDIEGSELRALKGAKKTIIRDNPKLAICIYHKPWDVYEIAEYILSIVPDYKLFIRHYDYYPQETVLYAVK